MPWVLQFVPLLLLFQITLILAKAHDSSNSAKFADIDKTVSKSFGNTDQDLAPLLHTTNRRVKRIVGGYETPEAFYTSMIQIRFRDNSTKRMRHRCGGTLIRPKFVLTAAHCLDELDSDPTHYDIVAGDWDITKTEGTEQQIKISKFHVHPKYQGNLLTSDDMLILELETSVTLSEFVTIANLPKSDFSYFNGRMCTMLGWGATKFDRSFDSNPGRLRAAQLPIYNMSRCLEIVDEKQQYESLQFSICAGYPQGAIDACSGDSGGGLLCQENDGITYLTGVHSLGSCGTDHSLGVYAKVADYIEWIEQIVSGKKTTVQKGKHPGGL